MKVILKLELTLFRASPRDVMAKALECGLEVSEFEFQSRYFIHFRTNKIFVAIRSPMKVYMSLNKETKSNTFFILVLSSGVCPYIWKKENHCSFGYKTLIIKHLYINQLMSNDIRGLQDRCQFETGIPDLSNEVKSAVQIL